MFKKLSSLALSVLVLVSASMVNATASDKESEQKLLSENEEVTLFEEPAHITAYREKGYSILYVKNGVKDGDGSSINSPLEGNTLPVLVQNYVKPEYDKNNNKKILFAVVGKLACGWYGNQTALTGYDIVVTSATGTSEDYIYPSGGSTPAARPVTLTGAGNMYTFDNITLKVPHSEAHIYAFTAGNAILKNIPVTKDSNSNKFFVSFGNNDTSTYAGGKIEIYNSNVDILRGSSYINANTEYVIGDDATIGQFIPMNNGAKIDGNAIVTINGGTVTTLYTTPKDKSGIITGDYVTYLNSGSIGTVVKYETPNENKGVLGKTILIVNDNTADIPSSISDMPYIVSYTGDGNVTYDTATDKLLLVPTNGNNKVTVNDTVYYGSQSIDITAGTMTVMFDYEIQTAEVTFDANGGAFGEENKKTIKVNIGEAPEAPMSPSKEGFTFMGWSPEFAAVTSEGATYKAIWEANHIADYREDGYNVIYVKNSATGDGSSVDSPLPSGTLPDLVKNYIKPEYDKNNNKKILIATVGKLACGWYGNQAAETGYDIVVTSATGTSDDYIYPSGGSTPAARPIMLTGAGNVFTFDNITVKIPHSEGQLNTFTAGNAILKNVSVIKESDTNKFIVTFGNNDTSTYVGGKIEIYGSKVDVLRGSSYMNANTEYVIGSNASVDKFISMNNGAKIDGNVIVTIDGGTVTTLYTTPANASGVITGDYVTYLNSGTIGTIVKNSTPNENKGVLGKTILIVNDNTADVTANISDLPYLVSFTGDGNVVYNTESDKLELKCGANSNKITVNGNVIYGNTEIELTGARTTVEFGYENIVTTANATFDANGGFWGDETTKTVETTIGEVPTAPENPILEGFEFKGWTPELTAITSAGATYTAVWEKIIEESDHIKEYRSLGYDIVYIKADGNGDGTKINAPMACTDLRAAIKALDEKTTNKKIVFAVIGGIGCGTSGNDTTEKGYDIVVTSATGVYSASADYINMTSGDIALIGGNSYTFDKIHFETKTDATTYLYAAGAENVTITEDTTSNGDNAQNGNTKRFAVGFGMKKTNTTYAGGTINVKADVRVLNTAIAYSECNITGDVAFITEDSSIGYLYVGGAGYISGNAKAQINGGYVNNLYNLSTGSVSKNVIVEINDGAVINNLYTTGETAWTKVNGDYVIYLNDGTINTITKAKDPQANAGVIGKTILIVNDNTADVPANISGLPYLVSFAGDGNVEYDTEKDKLIVTLGKNSNTITINDTVYTENQEIELSESTTTIAFSYNETKVNVTFDANGGAWGEETTKSFEMSAGETPEIPENPAKSGFVFMGWSPEVSEVGEADVNYTAIWEANHINVYRELGYGVVYIRNDGNGDGTSMESPLNCTDLRATIKALESTTENKKIVLAVIGGISCGTSGNETTEKGFDIAITSASGTYSASADFIDMTSGNIALIGGNSYTFDKIHFETNLSTTTYLYAAGAELTITENTTSNGTNTENGNTKRFAVGFGMNKTNTAYTGGTINVKSDVRVLNTAVAYSECNITGDVTFITEDASIGYLFAGGAGYISGNAIAQINGGYVNNLYNSSTGSVSENVIVEINNGATVNTLYTTGETAWAKVVGDYVIYLNEGTINTVAQGKVPNSNAGVRGKTILIVNDNTADVPANISNLPYLVSFAGDGNVEYDTEKDKLILAPSADVKFVKVTNGDNTTTYNAEDGSEVELLSDNVLEIDIVSGTTTVEFLSDGTIKPEIAIAPDTTEVEKSKGVQFEAIVTPDEYSVVWSIVTDGISERTTISENGYLTVAEDETSAEIIVKATISAESREFSATATVTVKEKTLVNVTKDIKIKLVKENGTIPMSFAKLRIYKDNAKSELVSEYTLEDAETTSSEIPVSVTLTEGTYYAEVIKNGYLTYKTDVTVTNEDISIENIALVPGDIKGSFDAECGDGVIDIDDFIRVLRGFASDTSPELSKAVDINEDGFVNVTDIAFVKANLGRTAE